MTKHHVIRHSILLDVKVDPSDAESLIHAAVVLDNVAVHVAGVDHATLKILDSRVIRVTAPEPEPEPKAPEVDPEPVADDLGDMPEHLRRTAPKAAE